MVEYPDSIGRHQLTTTSSVRSQNSPVLCVTQSCVPVTGKLILEMEDGSEILFENPGDVVVQRGTVHAWRNPGPGWTRWLTILIDAQPAVVNGVALTSVMM